VHHPHFGGFSAKLLAWVNLRILDQLYEFAFSSKVETHGARKLFSLLDHEFARSGSCAPRAKHEVSSRSRAVL
jgi:hypothetical protein